jgi:glycosyltransferase involved in cell wall biosynthesis
MNIIITGTHGIPNRYGGFEAFAEKLSIHLTLRGHQVAVYTPDIHPWKEDHYQGVQLIREPFHTRLGPLSTLAFDRLCFADIPIRRPDVVLNCGTPGALFFNPDTFPPVITLTDGLEWRRKKWSSAGKSVLHLAEKRAVQKSRLLIADHPLMVEYFEENYGIQPIYIPYGADLPTKIMKEDQLISLFKSRYGWNNIIPGNYLLTIARIEPENNISMIIDGFLGSSIQSSLIIVGNIRSRYGKKLAKRFHDHPSIGFVNGIYDEPLLSALRYYAKGYIHGHSVGGTNPSLLEAMAAGSIITAHDNAFNRYLLGDTTPYFANAEHLTEILRNWGKHEHIQSSARKEYIQKVREQYQWDHITDLYVNAFREVQKD